MELENDNGIEVILLHQDDNDPIEVVAMHGDEGGIMVTTQSSIATRGGNRPGRPTMAYDLAYIKPDLN